MPIELLAEQAEPRLTGVLLAAGAGTRFGMPKVRAAGGRWARTAVRALADGGCTRVLVVLGADLTAHIPGAEIVVAGDWSVGLSRSVAAGLARARGDVVVGLVDTPDIGAQCVRRVIRAGRRSEGGTARAEYDGVPGHPVYLAARHREPLIAALLGAGPRDADRGLGPHLPETTELIDCGDLATGLDIDRPVPIGGAR
ncbi:NTP transferase domain-containing protein [Nocardiopsis tropica]|uniref:nucleotidyltransferase family protein n=1 Tax=Tsukamurella strandjordii TaxID=147577 RepID=UPI0031CF741A